MANIWYHTNQNIEYEGTWCNDKLHGLSFCYSSNGIINFYGDFAEGKHNGYGEKFD